MSNHEWIPEVKLSLNAGSIGSTTGFYCIHCGENVVLWPRGIIEETKDDTTALETINRERARLKQNTRH